MQNILLPWASVKLSAGCHNCFRRVHRSVLTKNVFIWNACNCLIIFFTLSKKCFGLLANVFWRGCQNWFLCVQRNLLRKIYFFEEFFCFFFVYWKKSACGEFYRRSCRNWNARVQGNNFGENKWLKNWVFIIKFGHAKNLLYCRKFFVGIFKFAFCFTIGFLVLEKLLLFLENKLVFRKILDIERKNFGLVAKRFWQGCQNCILRDQRNFSKRNNFCNRFFFFNFGHWVKSFCFLPWFHRQCCQNCILSV